MRRLLVGLCLIGASALPFGGSAVAKPPVGGCPTPRWSLAPSPQEDGPGARSEDQNGDGLSCFLEVPEGGGIFTIIDNISHSR
jgi:hypothetical protein